MRYGAQATGDRTGEPTATAGLALPWRVGKRRAPPALLALVCGDEQIRERERNSLLFFSPERMRGRQGAHGTVEAQPH